MGTPAKNEVKTIWLEFDYGTFYKKCKQAFVAISEVLQNILTMAFPLYPVGVVFQSSREYKVVSKQ